MTRLMSTNFTCPCCKYVFETKVLVSSNNAGPCTTDLRQFAGGYQPIYFYIHTCINCGFSGDDEDFKKKSINNSLRTRIKETITPLIQKDQISAAQKYEYAAWIAQWQDEPSHRIGSLYHHASWCSVDDKNTDEEIKYRKLVIERYENAIRNNEINDKEKPVYLYLLGELSRRLGKCERATFWFNQVQMEKDDKDRAWLLELVEQQKTNPKEYIERRKR